ncbi:MAG: serine/threonine-protein kinase [Nostoc sp. DedQUE12a]|nr:serine/threonine-protein kinase [Nostoc sp. DedQUE12a]
MEIKEILKFIKEQVVEKTRKPLTFAEEELIYQCWKENKPYEELEDPFCGHTIGFIKTQIAPKLWDRLTQVTGRKVTKRNFRSVLEKAYEEYLKIDVVGQIIRERYQINQVINKGDFSKIYLAEDLDLKNKLCIVKQIIRKKDERVTKKNFDTEVSFLYQLGWHSQIPGYLSHFEDGESFYLVYEYVEGEALSQKLPEEESGSLWEENSVINLLLNVLNVLEFVHKRGVIHRDIRPSNLIESPNGKIYLINFGLLKELGALQTRTFTGTLGYSAPEQSQGIPKYCSDIYAVAMLGIQALTGVPPKEFKVNYETGEIIWHKQVKTSQELTHILNKMARPNWKERYQSATEVLQDLKKLRSN